MGFCDQESEHEHEPKLSETSLRCAEGRPRVLVIKSLNYMLDVDKDGDRRCRSVGRLYSSIQNMNFVMMLCDDCDLFDRERGKTGKLGN